MESMEQEDVQFNIAYIDQYYEAMHESDYLMQELLQDPIAFKASSNPGTLYYHQAMVAPERDEFRAAIATEVNGHINNNHWECIPISQVPKDAEILDSVWAFKRKRDIHARQVTDWKRD
eukprot:4728441-Ditylum_brightwellii.AAC.1